MVSRDACWALGSIEAKACAVHLSSTMFACPAGAVRCPKNPRNESALQVMKQRAFDWRIGPSNKHIFVGQFNPIVIGLNPFEWEDLNETGGDLRKS